MLNLQALADRYVEETRIPALTIATWIGGEVSTAASGVLNLSTNVTATTESLFQIGSISKVLTACLAMKLVEKRRLDLDEKVQRYLRSFSVADAEAAANITIRQLMNHTNGIAGDYFPDDLKDDGPHIARYVDRCSQLPIVHSPGAAFSYSNAAYAVLGRVIEVVYGNSWFDAVEDEIFGPLEMHNSICRPHDLLPYRAALGHVRDSGTSAGWKPGAASTLRLGRRRLDQR